MKKNSKPVQEIINFQRPLFYSGILQLLSESIKECNEIFSERWHNLPFIKRIFIHRDRYHLYYNRRIYCSYDGKAPMQFCRYLLNTRAFPNAKYENRYLIAICGARDYLFYFNVIPGIAEENQFGTLITECEPVSCITIKANMKSNPKWKEMQTEFLKMIVPIIERIDQEKN